MNGVDNRIVPMNYFVDKDDKIGSSSNSSSSSNEDFQCPFTQENFKDMVLLSCGHPFERKEIEEHIERKGKEPKCPYNCEVKPKLIIESKTLNNGITKSLQKEDESKQDKLNLKQQIEQVQKTLQTQIDLLNIELTKKTDLSLKIMEICTKISQKTGEIFRDLDFSSKQRDILQKRPQRWRYKLGILFNSNYAGDLTLQEIKILQKMTMDDRRRQNVNNELKDLEQQRISLQNELNQLKK